MRRVLGTVEFRAVEGQTCMVEHGKAKAKMQGDQMEDAQKDRGRRLEGFEEEFWRWKEV